MLLLRLRLAQRVETKTFLRSRLADFEIFKCHQTKKKLLTKNEASKKMCNRQHSTPLSPTSKQMHDEKIQIDRFRALLEYKLKFIITRH